MRYLPAVCVLDLFDGIGVASVRPVCDNFVTGLRTSWTSSSTIGLLFINNSVRSSGHVWPPDIYQCHTVCDAHIPATQKLIGCEEP